MAVNLSSLTELGLVPELAKKLGEKIDAGTLQIGTSGTTAMAGNRVPTLTIRGGVLLQAAIPSLTGTVGTANDAMTAVPDATAASTDTSAASLTSVNAAILALNNDLADLQAKVNAVLVALRAAGTVTP